MKTTRLAAIDIGSNSLKLAVVEAASSDSFTMIAEDRERVRLGHGTLQNHILSEEAFELSREAVSRFRSIAENRETDALLAVATASVREARNASRFVDELERLTGVKVEVLSSIEEARLIGIAVAEYFGSEYSSLLNIDIGGGSTEISLMKDSEPEKLFSMKLGAVGLSERFLISDPPKPKELRRLRKEIKFALAQPQRKIKGETWDIATGTSGTIKAVSMLIAGKPGADEAFTPPIHINDLIDLNDRLKHMTIAERTETGVINERRAEVIVAGAQILEGVMRTLRIETVVPCPYALREGVIIDHLREIATEDMPPVPDVEDLKLRDVFAVGRRFGYEEQHALQVASIAERIFDGLSAHFKLARRERTLLSAAALLHDVGYHISHESHHKHSLYLIKNSEMTGFSESEKLLIANIARYHRKSLPSRSHPDYAVLRKPEKALVRRLSSILRLADGLDRSYKRKVREIRIEADRDVVTLTLVGERDLSNEVYATKLKKEAFEREFKCHLNVVQERSAPKKVTA
ncbi:MAG: Ppx/GppA family phosphatase [Acidobacteria bacterium]|nr:MAG: Ppx/GppA family phosphatase [Acidobacteriota bacterium]REJ99185.1 MAG: Ppx/GppA family phosphatase [Acidobacteriota bacterium]REK16094.1 MAG: Ppx/GppA family phosphatase [Acidobacteriota bacterium]REK43775.1 MAG: Ppx/GppA family phosphatase [Acidobacteriota bacterium]